MLERINPVGTSFEKGPVLSIITVVFNNQATIADCLDSILSQSYPNIELIVIDGGSTDNTLSILKKYREKIALMISEKDAGIYDAMNKGIRAAKGDYIAFLNSDDMYANENVIAMVADALSQSNADALYGNLVMIDPDAPEKVVRFWNSGRFKKVKFYFGWHPPHPTFFLHRSIAAQIGGFDLSYQIAADYDMMIKVLKKVNINIYYLPEVLVKMRIGGKSNRDLTSIVKANIECFRSWHKNGLVPNPFILFTKPLSKLLQFLPMTR